jgi:CRISPR-associated endonuclease Cas3-HD
MTENYLAHSAKGDCPAQTYMEHIMGVQRRATEYADEAEAYSSKSGGLLKDIVQQSAMLHDLGKLDNANQGVLCDTAHRPRHLPVNHVDAGSAALKSVNCLYSALAVYSHHRGLPDMEDELTRKEKSIFRDGSPNARKHTDETLPELLKRHKKIFPENCCNTQERFYEGDIAVFFRMMLSCLADADHTDTAVTYGQAPESEDIFPLLAAERLALLDRYVSNLGSDDERSLLRKEMYLVCRDAEVHSGFTACDSPVGSGKTTAVMAHLLQQAIARKARRVFVVLPYTSIIQQSVDTYRKALVLPGENPEKVVAELHCRADFQDKDTRYLTSLWKSPIIVTTAVAFFETLASNQPSTLRRLHELPGSVIFMDEAHNALPLKLLPLAWRWMNTLAEDWSCYWVLASGSLVRYWTLDSLKTFEMYHPDVSELVGTDLRQRLMRYERKRIVFRRREENLSPQELVKWVQHSPGPRLLILNTVQSAAVIADDLCAQYGRECVEHLSTALTPEDRNVVIKRVKARLKDNADTNWTLVATSCVEAGVDFSFRTGFRELSSLLSLLQAAGRVNRHGAFKDAEMWSFSLQDHSMLRRNDALKASCDVLKSYFDREIEISSSLSTQSMNDEILRDDTCLKKIEQLMNLENAMQFQTLDEQFQVIDSNSIFAIVDESLARAIEWGQGDWRMMQKKAVSIRREKVRKWSLKEIANGIYQWTLGYDSFLGYMRGVLDVEKLKS